MIEEERVTAVLETLGLAPKKLDADGVAAWGVLFKYPSPEGDTTLIVARPKDKSYLVVQGGVSSSAEHAEVLAKRPAEEFRAMVFRLHHDLVVSGRCRYRVEVPDGPGQKGVAIRLSQRLWDEEFSGPQLERALDAVFDAVQLCRVSVRQAAGADVP